MITSIKVGMHVRVVIRGTYREQDWHHAAVDALHGVTGTVSVIEPDKLMCLVSFDAPVEKWAMRSSDPDPEANQLTCFHFHFGELEELLEKRGAITCRTDASKPNNSNAGELHAVEFSDRLPGSVDLLYREVAAGPPAGFCVEKAPHATCPACEMEAELGTEDVPHPIDPRVHSCALDKQGTTRYVAGFFFDPTFRYVALVLKKRPDWQAGKWNAVGGHVEDGEPAGAAMAREFHEEAGILHYRWRHFATVVAAGAESQLDAYFAVGAEDEYIRVKTDEQVDWVSIEGVRDGEWPVVTNTRWLLELALSICRGVDPCQSYLIQEETKRDVESTPVTQPQ
jgi:8-oxo-dGTP diphosphatase